MGHFNLRTPLTRTFADLFSRVKVDQGSTSFFLGREFRAYKELIAAASWSTPFYFRFTSTVDFILLAQRLEIDSGACRLSVWQSPTFAGTWSTTIPAIGKNRMSGRPGYPNPADPAYVPQCTITTGGTFSGGTEVDLLRTRTGANQGNQSSANVGVSSDDYRGLPVTEFGIKIEPITGLANTDALNGKYEIIWEERPQGNVG